jgi:hypothetical protein
MKRHAVDFVADLAGAFADRLLRAPWYVRLWRAVIGWINRHYAALMIVWSLVGLAGVAWVALAL